MEWTPEIAGGFVTIIVGLVGAFTLLIKNMGARTDPEAFKVIKMMQANESKRDEVQAEYSQMQAESFKSLAASQESQAKSLEYLGQMMQGFMSGLTMAIEQLKPIPPMVASINNIEEQNKTMVTNMTELTSNSDQWEPLLKEIIRRLDNVQRTLDDLNPIVSETQRDLKETEREVATIRGHVMDIQKAATQEQEVVAVKPEPIEQGAKPDERTIEQLDDLAGGSGSAGDDKRDGDGGGSEASASASAS